MTHELALTLPHWRECLRPIAARLAQRLRDPFEAGRTKPGPDKSALLATPRKASKPRPYATRKWRAPTVEAQPSSPIACALCGEPVLKRRRRKLRQAPIRGAAPP